MASSVPLFDGFDVSDSDGDCFLVADALCCLFDLCFSDDFLVIEVGASLSYGHRRVSCKNYALVCEFECSEILRKTPTPPKWSLDGHPLTKTSPSDGDGIRCPYLNKQNQVNGGGQECPPTRADFDRAVAGETPAPPLDVQILHVERVVFDELPAGLYIFAHQSGEDGFALGDVF
jgi:hypothetical protein